MKLKCIFSLSCFFLLAACGGGGDSSPASTTKVNNPPVANNDSFNVAMNASTELDVLVNDTDGDNFSVTEVSSPTSGAIKNNQTNITYTPNSGYIGNDSFTYTITDTQGQSSSATVTLDIASIAPTAENDVVTTVQSKAVIIDILANDVSISGHQLTIASASSASNGIINHDGKLLTYTPNNGFSGNDTFTYVVRDSFGDESTASVGVTIENVKPIANDDSISSQQNTAVSIDVLANDVDAVGDDLSVTSLDAASHGIASIEENTVVYNPNDGFAGTETLNYTIIDAYGASSQATITIDITNTPPIANDDNGVVLKNESVTLDILSNDEDVVGDIFTIQSLSSPLHGSAAIVDGKVVYQPTTDYVGSDSFGYTIVDTHGASDSAFIAINVSADITVEGKVIGYEKAGLTVTVYSGDNEYNATTNTQGEYTVSLPALKDEDIITAKVEDAAPNFTMYAYLGDGGTLKKTTGNNNLVISNQHITNLTTAEYELIDLVLEGVQATTLNELTAAQLEANSHFQLQMAITMELINQDNGLTLPAGFNTVNQFSKSMPDMGKQMAKWRENSTDLYHQAFNLLMNNTELSHYPKRLTQGSHRLAVSGNIGFDNNVLLTLSENNQGRYLDYNDSQQITELTHTENGIDITLQAISSNDLDDLFPVREYNYCANGTKTRSRYMLKKLSLTRVYSTPQYDVYLQKSKIKQEVDNTLCNSADDARYHMVRHYHPQEFILEHKEMLLNTPTFIAETSYATLRSSKIKLSEDNSFTDTDIDDLDRILTGNWALEKDHLRLDYDDNFSVLFYQTFTPTGFQGLDTFYVENNEILIQSSSYLVADKPPQWQHNAGTFSNNTAKIADLELNYDWSLVFKNDNTGYEVFTRDGYSSTGAEFSWSLEGNSYIFKYYKLNDMTVSYCDVQQSNCFLSSEYVFEIIGEVNGRYAAKYKGIIYNNDGSRSYSTGNKIYYLYNFTPDSVKPD
ncbi:tandem-95 repeat protein [Colwellia sp. D2M02]|uniref:Ig-like domain-containing protein n=1 Tax=Colwellia sp. D2M02 TaxID=2841562 RepID=UPI001C0831B8|nr:Ig-like domain-containing protein [Colwellia sp. D2M02]MBU2892083.1 tandem-95 repeat protein [Colwellia sp. D2M02]